jgi:hypothetical protein
MLIDDWPRLEILRLRYIAEVLERTGGNKTRAAEALGIDRRTLNRILARERRKQARLRALRPAGAPAPASSPLLLAEARATKRVEAESASKPQAPYAASA